MNFKIAFQRGKEGRNKGLNTGIPVVNQAINGIQQGNIYGLAAPPKVGKSKLVDYMFILSPYLTDHLVSGVEIDWIYYSFEMSRVAKEFEFAAYFFVKDHGISEFNYQGTTYPITSQYLQGKLIHTNDALITVSPEHEVIIKRIYIERIVPLFGEYDDLGRKIRKGKIDFIEEKTNPTGINKFLRSYAERNGEFIKDPYQIINPIGDLETKYRTIGWRATNPDKRTIIITDTLRKLHTEQRFNLKQTVDKMIEYQVELRNWCGFIFVDIIHLNRDLTDTNRIRLNPEYLYPTGDDVKDTGNLSEEANIMFTMFNPNDPKYNIKRHFGLDLHDPSGNLLYPHFKSLHLVDAREVEAPLHFRLDMQGATNQFKELVTNQAQYSQY